ncbi:MAG TPA: FHA domain-containing protein [Kofleriaceae bacterium]|nr:FHA domain-containing protein [Kofleriaceae bacterium]
MDEPTMAEEEHQPPPQLAVVRAPPQPGNPRAPSRMGGGGAAPPDTTTAPAWLMVQSGTDRGRRFPVKSGRNSIGRGVDNDIVLTDIAVSRRHLIIDSDGATSFVMTDLGSGNGTLVNDRDEDGAFRLSHGDRLELGNTVLVFECPNLAARAGAAPPLKAPPAKGKWSAGTRDDDEMSTVAGKKPAGPVREPPPRPPSQLRPSPPPPPRRTGAAPVQEPPAVLGGPGAVPEYPMVRGPRSTLQGPSPMPSPSPMPMQVSVPAPMPGPLRDMSPHVPPVPAHMPTMAADLHGPHGIGGHTPGSHPQLPLMPTGYSPYPPALAPQAYSPYPPPAYSSGAGPAPPRFQYPNGVMSAAPSNDRRKLLIGILAIAFVAVSAGIVMALVHGLGEEEGEGGVAAASPAAATGDAPAAPATGDAPAAPSAAPLPTAEPLPAAGDGAAPATTDAAGPRLASLYGDKQLNAAVFGTDEQFLSDQPGGAAGLADDGPPPEAPGKPDKPDKDRADKPDKSERKAETARRDKKERQAAEEEEEEEEEEDEEEEDVRPSGDAAAARRQATSLYKQKQFSEAAAVLRKSADGGGRGAGDLRADAGKFEQIGTLLSQAEKVSRTDPAKALESFKKAKRLDEEYGDGTHDGFIGARIGQVAPAAARSHMVYKRWAEAKRAADDAETYGAGEQVRQVRDSLGRKAEELYDQANELAQSGKSGEAAELARQVLKMVPKSSAIYGKASKLAKK